MQFSSGSSASDQMIFGHDTMYIYDLIERVKIRLYSRQIDLRLLVQPIF
jgi:hypothetical protein